MNTERLLEKIDPPAVFPRTDVDILFGKIISSRTLANLQSRGEGPPCFRLGKKKIIYERESFLAWLEKRLTKIGGGEI